MAGMAAKAVEAYFEDKDTRAQVVNDHLLTLNWGFNGGTMTIFLDFAEDDTHVHIEGIDFITVPSDKYDRLYKVLNEVNCKYRHVKFVLDTEEGRICSRDDAVIQLDSCGAECFELMIRMVRIVEDAYPILMKAIE